MKRKYLLLVTLFLLGISGIVYSLGSPFSSGPGIASLTWYDNSLSGFTSSNVQGVIDEIASQLSSIATSGGVSNGAYSSDWDGVVAEAPSKNAVYDQFVAIASIYESHTSNDIDPDRLAGDTSDDDLIADAIIAATITRDSEWNTIAKIETATSVNIIVSTEIDTVAELESLMTGTPNIIVATEIDTADEINALTTDADFILATAIGSTVQAYNATLAAVAGGTYSGDDSIATVGTITAGVWTATVIDGDYININSIDNAITSRDSTDVIAVWDTSANAMRKMTMGNLVSGLGGTGSSIVLDLADDGDDESSALAEIAVASGDTNSIFTEAADNKLLIDPTKDWPKADQADVALTGDSATAFFSSGVVELARGGTGSSLTDPNADSFMFWDDSDASTEYGTFGAMFSLNASTNALTVVDATDSVKGIASFSSTDLTVSSGAVSIVSGMTRDTEWDTIAEVETVWGSVNIILATEIDTSAELAGILTNETGAASGSPLLVFNQNPTLAGATFTGNLVLNANEIQSTTNIVTQLGDNAGSNYLGVQDSDGTLVWYIDSDGKTHGVAQNNPYITLDENDGTDYTIGTYDTTTDTLEFRRSATVNTDVDMALNTAGLSVYGNMNIETGATYQVNGTQINIGNLGAGGNWTPTGTINMASATLQNVGAGTVTSGDNYTTISNSASDDTINEMFAAINTWAAGVSAGTLVSLSDVGGDNVYTAGMVLIGDGSDSYDPKAISGDISLGSDGASVVLAAAAMTGDIGAANANNSLTISPDNEDTDTLILRGYDVDGAGYDNILTITSGNTPTLALAADGGITLNSLLPVSADGATIGSATAEWSDLYLAAGGVIYGENDQSNTLTSSATGWTMNLDLDVTGGDLTLATAGVKLTGSNGSLTILGLGDGQDEDIKIDLNSTANTIEITSPASSATAIDINTLNLVTTGTVTGRVPVYTKTEGATLTAAECGGGFVMVTAACTITLPAAATAGYGSTVCIYVRDASETVVVEVDNADKIRLYATALDAGDTIDSPGAAGNFICLMAVTDTDGSGTDGWISLGSSGTWTDGGAT